MSIVRKDNNHNPPRRERVVIIDPNGVDIDITNANPNEGRRGSVIGHRISVGSMVNSDRTSVRSIGDTPIPESTTEQSNVRLGRTKAQKVGEVLQYITSVAVIGAVVYVSSRAAQAGKIPALPDQNLLAPVQEQVPTVIWTAEKIITEAGPIIGKQIIANIPVIAGVCIIVAVAVGFIAHENFNKTKRNSLKKEELILRTLQRINNKLDSNIDSLPESNLEKENGSQDPNKK